MSATTPPALLSLQSLERYRPLLDDWPGFLAALATPLPGCVWANPLRIAPDHLQSILVAEGLQPVRLVWHPAAWRLPASANIGHRWWYQAGLGYSQEEAALLPVALLAPQPGERILDLCAAPGGKTAQIALRLGNRGSVVANDIRIDRIRALRANLERLGLLNVSITAADGGSYPAAAGGFDRVLVDAPCSCEGTLRKQRPPPVRNEHTARRYHRLQQALLQRAVALCRPGGRIVYATCTFAPEENECMIDDLLRVTGDDLRVLPAGIAGFRTVPGITAWNGRALDPQLALTRRIWPHHNDTGGFYIAVLEKIAADKPPIPPATLTEVPAPELPAVLCGRFGIPEARLGEWIVHRRTSRGLNVAAVDHQPPLQPVPEAVGLLLVKTQAKPPKPTTAGALLLAPQATRNVIELAAEQVAAYLRRDGLQMTPRQLQACTGNGYVLIRYCGFGLGTGYCEVETGRVQSLFPKRWAAAG